MVMKVIRNVHKALLVIAILVVNRATAAGGDGALIELKKSYSKSYSLGANEKVSFDHQFGALNIHTWDKNEVKTEVNITVSSDDEEYARSVLEAITIDDGRNGNGVYFKTNIGAIRKKSSRGHNKENRNITYDVYLPAVNPLNVEMQFGSTSIGDYRGPINIRQEYGSLSAGNLANVKQITSTYGSATINGIANGKLVLEYGDARVSSISGNVSLQVSFCQLRAGVTNEIKNLDINCQYGDVQMSIADNINASFNVRTSYAELKNKGSIKFVKEKEDSGPGPVFDHVYNAVNGNGAAKIKVKSEFTAVTIGANLPMEKNKKKERSI